MNNPNERVLIDTDVASYLFKGREDGVRYEPLVKEKHVSISFITVGEMRYWALKNNWGKKKTDALEQHLRQFVVIPFDNEIATQYARILVEREAQGRPILLSDAWIAACALRHSLPLITNNAKDFLGTEGLEVRTVPRSIQPPLLEQQ